MLLSFSVASSMSSAAAREERVSVGRSMIATVYKEAESGTPYSFAFSLMTVSSCFRVGVIRETRNFSL